MNREKALAFDGLCNLDMEYRVFHGDRNGFLRLGIV